MSSLNADQQAVVRALVRDVAGSVALRDASELTAYLEAEGRTALESGFVTDLPAFRQKLVDDLQQRLHDEFVDVSWPRCPRHPNHPLWLDGDSWWCTADNVQIARLGELGSAGD